MRCRTCAITALVNKILLSEIPHIYLDECVRLDDKQNDKCYYGEDHLSMLTHSNDLC